MTEREQHARYEIQIETYMKKIQIESRMIGELAIGTIIPSAEISNRTDRKCKRTERSCRIRPNSKRRSKIKKGDSCRGK